MRIVSWNCRIGGFRNKAQLIAPYRPDVLAVQEVEPIDRHPVFQGEIQPTYRDQIRDPAYPSRSIGVFSYTDTTLEAVDTSEPMFSFRRYRAHHGDVVFNVIAVWTAATKSKTTSYRQAHAGIVRHEAWIRETPTVLLGDFNGNASFRGSAWTDLMELMNGVGLGSAYHHYFGQSFGAETRPTHFHRGKEGAPFHLDYCFLPTTWLPHISGVTVPDYSEWRMVSDHVPLIVDLDLPPTI